MQSCELNKSRLYANKNSNREYNRVVIIWLIMISYSSSFRHSSRKNFYI